MVESEKSDASDEGDQIVSFTAARVRCAVLYISLALMLPMSATETALRVPSGRTENA